MPNFTPLGWVDTYALAASLPRREGLFKDEAPRVMRVRELKDDRWAWWHPKDKWPELHILLSRLERHAKERFEAGIEFGKICLEMLDPAAETPWRLEGADFPYIRALIPLRSNPATWFLCGPESVQLAIGHIAGLNVSLPCSTINLGDCAAVWLSIDWKPKAQA